VQYHDGDQRGFTLLFVCTGNLCRSPFAELLMNHLMAQRLGPDAWRFTARSAGLHAVVGAQMHYDTRDELMPWGLDGLIAGRFAARQFTAPIAESADLILGATPQHRSTIIDQVPSTLGRVFSILEFARLAHDVDPRELPPGPVDRANALVELARRRRGLRGPADAHDDVVPDPIGQPPAVHKKVADILAAALEQIADRMAPVRSGPPPR